MITEFKVDIMKSYYNTYYNYVIVSLSPWEFVTPRFVDFININELI